MRALCSSVVLLAALAAGPQLCADEPSDTPERGVMVVAKVQDLNLTPEQEAKLASIRSECRPKIEEAAKELSGFVKEEKEKITAVLTPEQLQKVQSMREERREHRGERAADAIMNLKDLDLTGAEMAQIASIRQEYRPKIEAALKEFRGILTEDQRRGREEGLKAGKSRAEIWESMNLSDEQKAKLKAACSEVRGLVKDEMSKVRDCLSEEQQSKLGDLREERHERARDRWAARVASFEDLNLTDEQKNSIRQIRSEYRPKIHEAGNKLRAAVREEISMVLDAMRG